jgi:macrodomain Ter protein organizer (MatP/YcbG family)
MARKKVMISLSQDVYEQLKTKASELGITVSAYITLLVQNKLNLNN